MSFKSLTNYYVWGIKSLLFIIPFLSFWISKSMFFPYITGRNFTFRILAEIAFILWLALVIFNKEYRPKMTPIVGAILLFVTIVGVANIFGVDPYHSFWSRLERMEGYLMILHLVAYFFLLSAVFRTKKEWLTFFSLFAIAGILVGSYGVLQLLGLREAIQGGDTRIDGTIGNPTYLAAYLTLVIMVALILFFNSEKKWLKYFYGATALFSFVIIYFSATRGAALSFLITIPIFLALYIFLSKNNDPKEKFYKKLAAGFLALIILLPIGVWLLRDSSFVRDNPVLGRLTSVSLSERTIKARFLIWGVAWQAFKERPILGWGQENFLEAFLKYYDPRLYDQEPWFDHPHNIIFEWLVNAGIFGLAAYLAIFVALFMGIRRLIIRKIVGKGEAIVLVIAPITYFIQNLFVFDNFNTYVLFFALLAYANRMAWDADSAAGNASFESKTTKLHHAILTISLVATTFIIYFVNIKPMQVARGIISSYAATTEPVDSINRTMESFKKTLGLGTFAYPEGLEQLAKVAKLAAESQIPLSVKLSFIQFSINKIEEYLKDHPKDIRLQLLIANVYHSLDREQYAFQEREHILAALKLSPNKQQTLFVLADNYLITNEFNKSLELLEKAASLDTTDRDAYVYFASVGVYANRTEIVKNSIEALNNIRLNTLDQRNPAGALWAYIGDLDKIASAYLDVGSKSGAQDIYRILQSLEPEVLAFQGSQDWLLERYRENLENLENSIRQ